MKKILSAAIIISFSLIITNCGGKGSSKQYPRFSSGDNEFINFTFPASKNSDISGDITGVITDPRKGVN